LRGRSPSTRIALDPKFQQNRYLLAVAQLQCHEPVEALPLLYELCRETSDNLRFREVRAHAVQMMGGAQKAAETLLAKGKPETAGGLLLEDARLVRGDCDLLWRSAAALMQVSRLRLAKRLFEKIFELDPTAWSAGWNAHYCGLELSQVDGALDWLRRLDHPQNPDRNRVLDTMLYIAPLSPGSTMAGLRELAVSSQKILAAGAVPMRHAAGTAQKPILRIGFLSRIFHLENYAQIYLGLFRHLDREAFEVIAVWNGTASEPAPAVRAASDELLAIGGMPAKEAAQAIRDAAIDILVDCNGFGETEGNRILDFKPAPIQAVWSNKHCTSGQPTMDWIIADPSIDGVDAAHFVERIYRLPCFHIDMPPALMPAPSPAPLLRKGHVTLGAQIAGLKLNRAMLGLWARILAQLPDAKLLVRFGIVPDTQDMIREFMATQGIAADRLILALATSHEAYLASFAELDLVLDRFPISGGVTSLEALRLGIPVISWTGESWASRRGGTLLRQLGLPELVADSADGFVDLAVALCRDPDRLVRYRETLAERVKEDGAGGRRLAEAMGDAFRHFWQERAASARQP
jgi:hypothetical protein